MKKTFFLLILMTLMVTGSFVQESTFKYIKYDVEDGLPCTQIYSVLCDHQGFLWFCTDDGVSRFDGYSFENYTHEDGLAGRTIFRMYEDHLNRIWFMGFNGTLSYYEDGQIFPFAYNSELKGLEERHSWVTNMWVDSNEVLSFFMFGGDYGTISKSGFLEYDKRFDQSGDELIISFEKISSVVLKKGEQNSTFSRLTLKSENWNDYILECNETENRKITILDEDPFIFKYGDSLVIASDSGVQTFPYKTDFHGMSTDNKGRIWVRKHEMGIIRCNDFGDFYLKDEAIDTLFKDLNISNDFTGENGEVWWAVENDGVYHIVNQDIESKTFAGTIKNAAVVSLKKTDSNELVYATDNGSVYKVNKAQNHQLIAQEIVGLSDVHLDSGDAYFVSCLNDERISGSSIMFNGRFIYMTSKKDIWTAYGNSAYLYRNGELVYTSGDENINDFFHMAFEDQSGKIWLGGAKGLYCFEDDHLISMNHLFKDDSLPYVVAMEETAEGTIILAMDNKGVAFLIPAKKGFQVKEIKFKDEVVNTIHVDDSGHLWVGLNSGVLKMVFNDSFEYSSRKITSNHGLLSNEVNCINSIGNTIYIGTSAGLSFFDKNDLSVNEQPPKVHINAMVVNEKRVEMDTSYQLEHNQNDLQFQFVGLCYRQFGKVRYNYKLEGIETHWKTTQSRVVRYPSLSPGDYVFKVRACNEDGYWSTPEQIRITIANPFWKTAWFIFSVGFILLIVLLFIFYQLRKNAQKKRQKNAQIELQKRKIIETELKALRAQMNPHFTFNTLNSIQNSIKKLDQKTALVCTDKFSSLLRKVLENSQELFISIQEETTMLKLYIELQNIRFNNTIDYEISVDPLIDQEFQEIPSFIIQPFVENAILHGLYNKPKGKKELRIKMFVRERQLHCTIEDSGIGRTKSREINRIKNIERKSLGIEITKERLAFLHKEKEENLSFTITDLYDKNGVAVGTRVEILFGPIEI